MYFEKERVVKFNYVEELARSLRVLTLVVALVLISLTICFFFLWAVVFEGIYKNQPHRDPLGEAASVALLLLTVVSAFGSEWIMEKWWKARSLLPSRRNRRKAILEAEIAIFKDRLQSVEQDSPYTVPKEATMELTSFKKSYEIPPGGPRT